MTPSPSTASRSRSAARVVDGVSAAVDAGEWVALIGPNGAGKTTLLRAVAGLVAFAGRVAIDGDDRRRRSAGASSRGGIALVPQRRSCRPG